MADTKKKGLDLQQTNGSFQVRGKVSGTESERFYKDTKTKTGKPMRMVNFGVEFEKDNKIYIALNGMERDEVYFSKKDEKTGKNTTTKVAWKDRKTFNKDGYKLIGVNVGVKKTTDDNGKEVNDKKILVEYDACEEIGANLKDEASVFVRGKIEYSTYNDKRQMKFVPNQVSLCKDIDFEDEKFEPMADFEQVIVFMGIAPNDDKSKFIVSAKIIGYNSIEDAEFVTTNEKLAKNLKKLKPYTAIKVYGHIVVTGTVEEVEEDDGWGESNPMQRVGSAFERELVITGADKDSIDTEVYSEEIIDEAIAKLKANKTTKQEYGDDDDDDWGEPSSKKSDSNDDDDEWGLD